MAATLYPGRWARDLLDRLGYRPTEHNITGLLAWQRAEGGHTANDSRWNPLNTTQPMPGATDTGTQGNIKQYRSYEQGMDATVKTLRNGRYGPILAALQAGTSASAVTTAVARSPWGTGSLAGAALPWARDTARKHPGLWQGGGPKGDGTGHVDGPEGGKGATKPSTGTTPSAKKKKRPPARSGAGRITLDVSELTSVISSLDRGAGQADTVVTRVGRSVSGLDQVLAAALQHQVYAGAARAPVATVTPDLVARVRQTTAPLTDPRGALRAVPGHLRWEAGLVRQVRWAATVADGGGTKADRRKVDQLLAALARGERITAGQRFALSMLLAGQLKVRPKGSSKPSTGSKPTTGSKPSSGSKPSTGTSGTVGRKALKIAKGEQGVRETSENYSTRIAVYQKTTGAYRAAWCASFVNWALRRAGKTTPGGGSLAAVATWVNKARRGESGLKLVSAANARPGDLVAYDWGFGTDFGGDGHIGILNSKVENGRWTAMEGNTSAGRAEIKHRSTAMAKVVFIRVS